jgi:hypothetical protein
MKINFEILGTFSIANGKHFCLWQKQAFRLADHFVGA